MVGAHAEVGLYFSVGPLVVDANRRGAKAVALERLQAVTGWNREVRQATGTIHLHKFAQRDAGDGGEPAVPFLVKKFLHVGVSEGPDHGVG